MKQKSKAQKTSHQPNFFHKPFWRSRTVRYGALAIIILAFSGLSLGLAAMRYQADAGQTDAASIESTDQSQAVAPEPTELPRQLDGVIVPKTSANLWPIAVMYDNNPVARPHAGLALASVVYNTLVEGGATRIMAVFSPDTKAGRIGPVRSARAYYLEWLSEYNGLYVHAGGSPQAMETISAFSLNDLNCIGAGARYCYRDRTGYAPHNLFTDDEKLVYALRDMGLLEQTPAFKAWRFKDDDALADRGSFNAVTLKYSSGTYNVRYQYDRAANVYQRFNGSDPHLDRNTEQQIAPKNVLIQIVPPIAGIHEKGRIDLSVTSSGRAVLLRDGLVVEGRWAKPTRVDRTVFYADDGTELKLNRGQTWVEVLPEPREFPIE